MRALLAGQGALPGLLYRHLDLTDCAPLVVELDGFPSQLTDEDPIRFRIEHLGSLLRDLHRLGVREICLAGHVARPKLDPAAVDGPTKTYVARIAAAIQQGDDGALREILAIIEEFGITVIGAHQLMPELLPTSGVLTREKLPPQARADATRGAEVVSALSAADLGQSCVISHGQVLAVEALGGTDWMLGTLGGGARANGKSGGVLFKAPKTGQDLRADMPAIGPHTIAGAARAGLDGIVIQAGGVMVLDLPETLKAAHDAGLFLWVRDAH